MGRQLGQNVLYEALAADSIMSNLVPPPTPPVAVAALADQQANDYLTFWRSRLPPLTEGLRLVQVFTANPRRLPQRHLVELARPAGWRGVVVSVNGQPVATSEIYEKNGHLKPSGFVVDGRAMRLVEKWFVLEADPKNPGGSTCEPRFLEVPSVGVEALWLHGRPEAFFVTRDGPSGEKVESLTAEEMENMISDIYLAKAPSREQAVSEEP